VILKYGIKKTNAKDWLIFPENRQTFIRRNRSFNGELYTILTNKVAKEKGTIVAMIAGTKAQAVIAIIEKNRLNYEIQF
jgi:hypothetical protein